jgi:lysine N6-hydroxylase
MNDASPSDSVLDLVGIGIGPSNLSLAALLEPIPGLSTRFYEATPRFLWHPGLLLPNATLQVSFLKDLVTLVSPTNRHSFMSFLHETGRLYRFIAAAFPCITRQEFSQYYAWVADRLDDLMFGVEVEAVSFDGDHFVVRHRGGEQRALNIVLGTGLEPIVPAFAEHALGRQVFHASNFLITAPNLTASRVIVIGGGQSGAEVVQHLLERDSEAPREVSWLSSRAGMLPLDDSPFTNERFFPGYVAYFRSLSPAQRARLLENHLLSSDGVSEATLQKIYRQMYALDFLGCDGPDYHLFPSYSAVAMEQRDDMFVVTATSLETSRTIQIDADFIVLCTGYRYCEPAYLEPIRDRINRRDGGLDVQRDHSVSWNGPADRRIFAQNAARRLNGLADSNLSLVPWRSSVIVNALMGREVYRTQESAAIELAIPRHDVEADDRTFAEMREP